MDTRPPSDGFDEQLPRSGALGEICDQPVEFGACTGRVDEVEATDERLGRKPVVDACPSERLGDPVAFSPRRTCLSRRREAQPHGQMIPRAPTRCNLGSRVTADLTPLTSAYGTTRRPSHERC